MKRVCLVMAGVIAGFVFVGQAKAHILNPSGDLVLTATPAPSLQVTRGDSIWSLATLMNLSWWTLASYNKVSDPNLIFPGQTLLIPPTGYQPPPMPIPAPQLAVLTDSRFPAPTPVAHPSESYGTYSFSQLESLWVKAGGPSWAESKAAEIALCESGGNPWAHNPSGATGLWQILGGTGNLYDPMDNAENAVRKFHESNDTFAQWVCQ